MSSISLIKYLKLTFFTLAFYCVISLPAMVNVYSTKEKAQFIPNLDLEFDVTAFDYDHYLESSKNSHTSFVFVEEKPKQVKQKLYSVFAANNVLGAEELEEHRGTFLPEQLGIADLNSTVTGNTVNGNSITGDNVFQDSAFQNFQGVGTVFQNSGNNVSLSSATIINVTLE